MATTTNNYRPANYPSVPGQGGDARYLKQELDKLSKTVNGLNNQIQNINPSLTSPANTIKGNNTGASGPTIDLSPTQVLAMLDGPGSGLRIPLLANTSFFVATTGSDTTGLGTSASPWATPQHAYTFISSRYDFNGNTVSVNIAAGTYNGFLVNQGWVGGGTLVFSGVIGDGTQVTIQGVSASGNYSVISLNTPLGGALNFQYLTFTSANGGAIQHSCAGTVTMGQGLFYGACPNGQHLIVAGAGAQINCVNNYTISGAALVHWSAGVPGTMIFITAITVTIPTARNFGVAFATAAVDGVIFEIPNTTWAGAGYAGCTGTRYTATTGGGVHTGGQLTALPGNVNGSPVSPGWSD